jgi:hypothetical protein
MTRLLAWALSVIVLAVVAPVAQTQTTNQPQCPSYDYYNTLEQQCVTDPKGGHARDSHGE